MCCSSVVRVCMPVCDTYVLHPFPCDAYIDCLASAAPITSPFSFSKPRGGPGENPQDVRVVQILQQLSLKRLLPWLYIYIYTYTHTYIHTVHMYIYIYIYTHMYT